MEFDCIVGGLQQRDTIEQLHKPYDNEEPAFVSAQTRPSRFIQILSLGSQRGARRLTGSFGQCPKHLHSHGRSLRAPKASTQDSKCMKISTYLIGENHTYILFPVITGSRAAYLPRSGNLPVSKFILSHSYSIAMSQDTKTTQIRTGNWSNDRHSVYPRKKRYSIRDRISGSPLNWREIPLSSASECERIGSGQIEQRVPSFGGDRRYSTNWNSTRIVS